MGATGKIAAFEWLKDMNPIHRALLTGAGGAALGGAALGGLRAMRPLDTDEGETKAKRRSAVVGKALLGALLGGAGGAAAGYLPKLLESDPPPLTPATDPNANALRKFLYIKGTQAAGAAAGHPITTAAGVLAGSHAIPRAVTFKRLQQMEASPQMIAGEPAYDRNPVKGSNLPRPGPKSRPRPKPPLRSPGHQLITDAVDELKAKGRLSRLLTQSGLPTLSRALTGEAATPYDKAMTWLTGQTPSASKISPARYMRPSTALAYTLGIPWAVNMITKAPEQVLGDVLRKGLDLK